MAPVAGFQMSIPSFNDECTVGEYAQPVLWKWCMMHRVLLETEAISNLTAGSLPGCLLVREDRV